MYVTMTRNILLRIFTSLNNVTLLIYYVAFDIRRRSFTVTTVLKMEYRLFLDKHLQLQPVVTNP